MIFVFKEWHRGWLQRVGHDFVTEQQGLGNQNIHCRTVAQCEVSKPEQYEKGIHAVGTGEQ